jgi:hypothetical protein
LWQACSNSDHWCLPTEFLAPWAVAYCGFASDCLQHAARPACARLVRAQFGAGHRANHSRCVGSEALHGKIQRAHSLFVRLRSESSGTAVRYGSNTRRRISGSRTTMVHSRTTIHRKRGKLLRWGSPPRSIRLGPAAAALLHAEQRALLSTPVHTEVGSADPSARCTAAMHRGRRRLFHLSQSVLSPMVDLHRHGLRRGPEVCRCMFRPKAPALPAAQRSG